MQEIISVSCFNVKPYFLPKARVVNFQTRLRIVVVKKQSSHLDPQ